MERLRASIKPELLIWARSSSGLDFTSAATKIGVKEETLSDWEAGRAQPTIRQLREAARVYRRPSVAFFLPGPPREVPMPIDFRLVQGSTGGALSPRAIVEIRLARRRRELALDLSQILDLSVPEEYAFAELAEDPEILANQERGRINVETEQLSSLRSSAEALSFWKRTLERIGVLVFQCTRVKTEELRAFSIAELPLPAIVLNPKDAENARIFSLFHEYCHIMLKMGGLCDPYLTSSNLELQRIEVFCNHFAGAFLAPAEEVVRDQSFFDLENNPASDLTISSAARKYKVSREVILRRLLTLNLVGQQFYDAKVAAIRSESVVSKSKEEMAIPVHLQALARNGRQFSTLVLRSYNEEKISLAEASEYLGLRIQHIHRLQSELF